MVNQKQKVMKDKEKLKEFLDACISSGKYVETGLHLLQEDVLKVEDIVNRYNDTTARTKIRQVVLLSIMR